jgi:hypothetical protein
MLAVCVPALAIAILWAIGYLAYVGWKKEQQARWDMIVKMAKHNLKEKENKR